MKTKISRLIFFLVPVILTLSSCEDYLDNCLRGNGNVVTETRVISDFNSIEMDGSFDVYFVQGTECEVIVEADENLMQYVVTTVRGENLLIKNRDNRCFDTDEPIKVFLRAPDLTEISLDGSGYIECGEIITDEIFIELEGSGDIYISGLNADFIIANLGGSGKIEIEEIHSELIEADISGSGRIELSGESTQTKLEISGSGQIMAFDLEQDICEAHISGSGNIYVFVWDDIKGEISGSGALFYKGSPNTDNFNITGSGRLVNRNK